ncbi:MAG: HAD-IA family hydrolase [Janthinobacterium lividum]
MFGWRNRKRPDVVAFDAIGTMFPLDPLRPALMTLGLPRAGLEGWYATAVHDALALTACGDFKPFTVVMEGALDQVLGEQGLAPPRAARRALLAQFKHLPARPDARDALRLVLRARMRPILLTNGSEAGTWSLLQQSGLDRLVERVVSVEDIEIFKPRPEVYAYAARQCRVKLNRMALVAVHPWDINGAKAAGCVGAYVWAERPFPSTMRKPDIEAPSLLDAVSALVRL